MTKFTLSNERKEYFDNKYLKRYRLQRLKGNWAEYRNRESKRFEKVKKTFPVLGEKTVWREIEPGYNFKSSRVKRYWN